MLYSKVFCKKNLLTLINIFYTFYSMWIILYIKTINCEYNSINNSNYSKFRLLSGYKMFKTTYK